MPPTDLHSDLTIDTAMSDAPFGERHRRIVDRPIDEVWPACLGVTVGEVRTLAPLMALRGLPRLLGRGPSEHGLDPGVPLLRAFEGSGFVILRRDPVPVDGRASVLFGAAGRFWSITDNEPLVFDGAADFLAFAEPGFARTVARLDAVDLGDGRTRIETETRVVGTDAASTRRFAPYWAVIRLPSGLIRRSWLAAIDRRVHR